MVASVDTNNMTNGDHWAKRAANLLAPVIHWAALTGRTMRDARDTVYRGVGQHLQDVWEELERRDSEAGPMLYSVLHSGREEKNVIASTAAGALEGYELSGALRSTEGENFFDVDDFINGGPFGMRADTVYITASSDDQGHVAPLVVGLLNQIQQAAYRRHRVLQALGDVTGPDGERIPFRVGGQGGVPTLFSLDELYGLAPLPNLPHMLSEGGSQGILIAAAIQEFALLERRWPEAQSFLTLFGHALVFPGLRDPATLRMLSELLGNHDVDTTQETRGPKDPRNQPPQSNYTTWDWLGGIPRPLEKWEPPEHELKHETRGTHRRPRYDPDAVSRGPGGPDDVFHFRSGGSWEHLQTLPYWRSAPWPPVLAAYVDRALSGRVPAWRWWEAQRTGNSPAVPDLLPFLPVPDLRAWAQWGANEPHPVRRRWGTRYHQAVAEREAIIARGTPGEATYGIPQDNSGTWYVTRPDALSRTPRTPATRASSAHAGPSPAATPAAFRRPEPILPFEATWGPEDDAMMETLELGDPAPARYQETLKVLEEAVAAEGARRRARRRPCVGRTVRSRALPRGHRYRQRPLAAVADRQGTQRHGEPRRGLWLVEVDGTADKADGAGVPARRGHDERLR